LLQAPNCQIKCFFFEGNTKNQFKGLEVQMNCKLDELVKSYQLGGQLSRAQLGFLRSRHILSFGLALIHSFVGD